MKKLFKSKKVVGAFIALVIAIVSVGLGVDLGEGTEGSVTDVVCQVITCEYVSRSAGRSYWPACLC